MGDTQGHKGRSSNYILDAAFLVEFVSCVLHIGLISHGRLNISHVIANWTLSEISILRKILLPKVSFARPDFVISLLDERLAVTYLILWSLTQINEKLVTCC